jgi:CRISPR-associated protein Csd1
MLDAIVDFARQDGLTSEPGLKPKTVRWLLVFSREGQLLGIQDLRGEDPKSRGREFLTCPDLTQQEMVAVGAGCRHFLVDSLDVVALLTKDGTVEDKLLAKHEFFDGLLNQAADSLPVLAFIAASLRDDRTLEAIRAKLTEGKAKPTDLATLAVAEPGGASVLVEMTDWRAWWQAYRRKLVDDRRAKASGGRRRHADTTDPVPLRMRCLLSGELVEPQLTHNKIEGLSDVGGLSMGDALTSFDKDAFSSYGLGQGANAAMGEGSVKAYVTALNHLIRRRSYRLAGTKVVYWYSGEVKSDDDPIAELLGGFGFAQSEEAEEAQELPPAISAVTGSRRRAQAESCARRLLDAIHSGQRSELLDFRFYALTLSANSGRVVIRDWMEGRFEELLQAVNAWFVDLAIIHRDGGRVVDSHKFAAILASTVRELKDAPPPMVTTLWRCAIKRQSIPYQVMAQTLRRVRIDLIQDEPARHARLGLLKAFCNREKGLPTMAPQLNEHETHPAYLCGRIMAVLAAIQRKALPDVGVGVVQRYYAAASVSPALVLGRLVRTAQIAHLPKIESDAPGLRHWFEGQLADIWQCLHQAPPRVLTLEGQTLFAMGYYHQVAQRYQTKAGSFAKQGNDESP